MLKEPFATDRVMLVAPVEMSLKGQHQSETIALAEILATTCIHEILVILTISIHRTIIIEAHTIRIASIRPDTTTIASTIR